MKNRFIRLVGVFLLPSGHNLPRGGTPGLPCLSPVRDVQLLSQPSWRRLPTISAWACSSTACPCWPSPGAPWRFGSTSGTTPIPTPNRRKENTVGFFPPGKTKYPSRRNRSRSPLISFQNIIPWKLHWTKRCVFSACRPSGKKICHLCLTL